MTYAGSGRGVVSGAKVTIRGEGHYSYRQPTGGGVSYSNAFRLRYIVQGSADNLFTQWRGRWRVNANGQPVLDEWSFDSDCRG